MEFALQRKTPVQRFGGLTFIALAHALVIGVLMLGATRTIPRATPPEDLTVVLIPPAPTPPATPIETSRQTVTAPQQVVTPVTLDVPPVVVDVISVVPTLDSAPLNPGPVSVAVSEGAGTPSNGLAAACPNAQGIRTSMRYPPEARRQGLQGDVLARFVVAANGQIRNIDIVSSSNRAFNSSVINAVGQFACVAQGRDVAVEVPFTFRLE